MTAAARFRRAYAQHRAAEGRGAGGEAELLALPYLRTGRLARQWRVRARTYDRFVSICVQPLAQVVASGRLRILDLGAGNGWLCYRLRRLGHAAIAVDTRTDAVDGLGAGGGYSRHLPEMFPRIAASFDLVPLPAGRFDLVVFNASLHYSSDLMTTMREAARLLAAGGQIAVLDSPFYANEADGTAMVAEKRSAGSRVFGALAGELLDSDAIEFLTAERLAVASAPVRVAWRRHRVFYPLAYELRPLLARLQRRRPPSRFDLWLGSRS